MCQFCLCLLSVNNCLYWLDDYAMCQYMSLVLYVSGFARWMLCKSACFVCKKNISAFAVGMLSVNFK
jgi:hypothetical protein